MAEGKQSKWVGWKGHLKTHFHSSPDSPSIDLTGDPITIKNRVDYTQNHRGRDREQVRLVAK
jgi:hypothetical protein